MREIKFRAWDGKGMIGSGDTWGVGNPEYAIGFDGKVLRKADNYGRGSDYAEYMSEDGHENYTLMQYTGLKDKNSVEIYEGDIVRRYTGQDCEGNNEVLKVVWHNRDARWKMTANDFNHHDNWCFSKEIIGNIYENPDLLKE